MVEPVCRASPAAAACTPPKSTRYTLPPAFPPSRTMFSAFTSLCMQKLRLRRTVITSTLNVVASTLTGSTCQTPATCLFLHRDGPFLPLHPCTCGSSSSEGMPSNQNLLLRRTSVYGTGCSSWVYTLPVCHSRAPLAKIFQDFQDLPCYEGNLLLIASPAPLNHLSQGLALCKLLLGHNCISAEFLTQARGTGMRDAAG